MDIRPLNKSKYGISKYRFRELYYFCMQYQEWKDELKYLTDSLGTGSGDGQPRAKGKISNPTATLGERRAILSQNCELIEETAKEASSYIAEYIIKAVTNEGITYTYLRNVMGIPCGKNQYYTARRKFYYLLSQKIK